LKRITLVIANQIGEDGAKAIAAMLEKNYSVTVMNVNAIYQSIINALCNRNEVNM